MIELKDDKLAFSFPEVHEDAKLSIAFQRTLRIPDDGRTYPLPPGLGSFPLRHVDDLAANAPAAWIERGGVMMPMYQAEALWLNFSTAYVDARCACYPFAVKIAAGKIDAVTGQAWSPGLHRTPQDYVVAPEQPWLDGFCVEPGVIRQFVAMPLGSGYTAEEQITGRAEYGGLQIMAIPMKREAFERRFPRRARRKLSNHLPGDAMTRFCFVAEPAMGFAPGGRMRQKIYRDRFDPDDWDTDHTSRCFVHVANSMVWRQITGEAVPQPPVTAKEYERYGLPWFDLYDEGVFAVAGSDVLAGLKSVAKMGAEKGESPLYGNESVDPAPVVKLRRKDRGPVVREFEDVADPSRPRAL